MRIKDIPTTRPYILKRSAEPAGVLGILPGSSVDRDISTGSKIPSVQLRLTLKHQTTTPGSNGKRGFCCTGTLDAVKITNNKARRQFPDAHDGRNPERRRNTGSCEMILLQGMSAEGPLVVPHRLSVRCFIIHHALVGYSGKDVIPGSS